MTNDNMQLAAFLFFIAIVGPTIITIISTLNKDEDEDV